MRKLAFEDVKSKFSDRGYSLLETNYVNSRTKMKFTCPNHTEKDLYISYAKLSMGRGCPYCVKLGKPSYEEVRSAFANRGYLLLDRDYKNSREKMEFTCNQHPFVKMSITYNHLTRGVGCRYCASENSKGERNTRWKGGVTNLNSFLRNCLKSWKSESTGKFDNICFVTGDCCDRLDIHHVKPFHIIRDEVLESLQLPVYETVGEYTDEQIAALSIRIVELHKDSEGVPLNPSIHRMFHSIYGHNAGLAELEEFKNQYKSGNILKQAT